MPLGFDARSTKPLPWLSRRSLRAVDEPELRNCAAARREQNVSDEPSRFASMIRWEAMNRLAEQVDEERARPMTVNCDSK